MAKRYDQLLALIDEVKPEVIVEVGVHRAMRARLMIKRALAHRAAVTYIGYDVFETMGEDFQREALNGKGMAARAAAESVLRRMKRARIKLVVGDTRATLHGKTVKADFVFIDGDHRLECIRGDYAALAGAPVVVFDDYFREGGHAVLPDLALYGANGVVDALDPACVQILPISDDCADGGVSHLAVVRRAAERA